MMTTLTENTGLDCGSISATPEGWKLRFSFPGLDRRYKFSYVIFDRNQVIDLASSYSRAYDKFEELKLIAGSNQRLTYRFNDKIIINVGQPFNGICIGGYRNPIQDVASLIKTIKELERIVERGDDLVAHISQNG